MSASPYGRGLIGLLKRGWHEIPGVMGASAIGLLGVAICCYDIYLYEKRGLYTNKFKRDYIVVRPDDPRANRLESTYPE